jgi:pilus assembly protein CpaC
MLCRLRNAAWPLASPRVSVSRARIVACVASALAAAFMPGAQVSVSASEQDGSPIRKLQVVRHKSKTFTFRTPFASAVVGSPDIADVLPMSDRVLYLQGKKSGTTNVSLFSTDKKLLGVLDVEVVLDAQAVAEKIRATVGSKTIKVSSSQDQIVLSGQARDAVEAEQAVEIAKSMSPDAGVVNLIRIASAQQVLLKVRFLEASRTAERDLGVNLFAADKAMRNGVNLGNGEVNPSTASGVPLIKTLPIFPSGSLPAIAGAANLGGNIDLIISALESKGLVRELAEPDLVALSGDTASFLAGGEVPVPVIQPSAGATTITVDYKPFGVQLTFQPTVLSNGVINLRLTPSVSELDYANGVTQQGFKIPALKKREARTTIELRDGQSFAIAGLLQSEGLRDLEQVPWLGTVPVLGSLFRSASYRQKETDLVVIVTPHIIAPIAPGKRIATPLDSRLPSNDVDFFVNGQGEVPKKFNAIAPPGGVLAGPYGHIVPLDNK